MHLDPCEEVQSSSCWLWAVQTRSPVIGFDLRIGPRSMPPSDLKLCCTNMYLEVQMWRQISNRLEDYPGRLKVAKMLVELGLSVRQGKIFCGEIEQSELKIARGVGVDRRTVRETAEIIESDPLLQPVFKGLKPAGPFLANVARFLGYRVIEIYADPHAVGIVTEASSLISREGIAIRQAVADDPDLTPEPKLTLVVEREPSGDSIQKMLKIQGVTKVATY
jgi:predicted regulator of amino acid metabolism with ACT domain